MTVPELTARIEAIADRYVSSPVRRLDLTMDVLRLVGEAVADEQRAMIATVEKAMGVEVEA